MPGAVAFGRFGIGIAPALERVQQATTVDRGDQQVDVAVGAHPRLGVGFGGCRALDEHDGDIELLRDLAQGLELAVGQHLADGDGHPRAPDGLGERLRQLPSFLLGAPPQQRQQALPTCPGDQRLLGQPHLAMPPERQIVIRRGRGQMVLYRDLFAYDAFLPPSSLLESRGV